MSLSCEYSTSDKVFPSKLHRFQELCVNIEVIHFERSFIVWKHKDKGMNTEQYPVSEVLQLNQLKRFAKLSTAIHGWVFRHYLISL